MQIKQKRGNNVVKQLDEKTLANMFRERFLNRHLPPLNAVNDILMKLYNRPYMHRDMTYGLLKEIYSKGNLSKKLIDPPTETVNMRSLRNAWYHECSLNYPSEEKERMKFPAWKIIQCYYAVFSSIAALVRSFDDRVKGHDKLLNTFGTLFLRNDERKRFFVFPLCIHLKQNGDQGDCYDEILSWEYGNEHHLPKIMEGLKKTKEQGSLKGIVTIPHYLKSLRDWATYEDSYLFFRMYGKSIHINLDTYLRHICEAYITQAEAVMIKLYGFDIINFQKEVFSKNLIKYMDTTPKELTERFELHKKWSTL